MRLRDIFRLGRKTHPVEVLPNGAVKKLDRFDRCLHCGHTGFYQGPSGGAAQNVECAQCGARYNIGLVPGGPILLEELSGPKERRSA